MPTNYVCLPIGEGASCYDCRQLETITVLWNDFIKSIETGSLHEKKNDHSQLLFTYRKSRHTLQIC